MRRCPSCGGTKRRTIAPAFFECLAPRRERASDEAGPACGERYVDSDRPRPSFVSRLGLIS